MKNTNLDAIGIIVNHQVMCRTYLINFFYIDVNQMLYGVVHGCSAGCPPTRA